MSHDQTLSPLKITQGENKTLKIIVKDVAKALQDLTGYQIFFTLKKRYDDTTPLILKRSTLAGGGDTQILIVLPQTGTTKGLARIFLLPSDSTPLQVGDYVCDCWVVDPGSIRTTIVAEKAFTIGPRVTIIP